MDATVCGSPWVDARSPRETFAPTGISVSYNSFNGSTMTPGTLPAIGSELQKVLWGQPSKNGSNRPLQRTYSITMITRRQQIYRHVHNITILPTSNFL